MKRLRLTSMKHEQLEEIHALMGTCMMHGTAPPTALDGPPDLTRPRVASHRIDSFAPPRVYGHLYRHLAQLGHAQSNVAFSFPFRTSFRLTTPWPAYEDFSPRGRQEATAAFTARHSRIATAGRTAARVRRRQGR